MADFVALTKPRLSGLVLFTLAPGLWLGSHGLDWRTVLATLIGTAGTVGAANTLNCVWERESDRFMGRTAGRPMPTHRLTVAQAVIFAVVLAAISLPLLWFGVNPLSASLGLLALISYAFVYTPMKSRSHWAMQVGALPGALPPLMGWTAATGRIELPGLALFAILFVWQLPHFIAIALFRRDEYGAAGLTSLPLAKGEAVARRHALGYVVAMLPISLLPVATGIAGVAFAVVAVALWLWFFRAAWAARRVDGGDASARQLFRTSLVYLTVLIAALALPV